jgi:hypothetical protein
LPRLAPSQVTAIAITLLVAAGCGLFPASASPSVPAARVEVLEATVRPPVAGNPVVAVKIRAPVIVGQYGFAWYVEVDAAQPTVPFGHLCLTETGLHPTAHPLTGGESGVVHPEFSLTGSRAEGEQLREGWLAATLGKGLQNIGVDGCILTFKFEAGYKLFGDTPVANPPPAVSPIARIEVRGDGTAMDATPLPIVTAKPTLSPVAIEAEALVTEWLPILSEWNTAAAPVAALLADPDVDLVTYARESADARRQLHQLLDHMSSIAERITQSELVDPFWNVVVNYAHKLDGLNGIAAGALAGDSAAVRAGYAELEQGVREAPGVVRAFLAGVQPYLSPYRASSIQGLLEAVP